jgi:hypothetical protein
LQILFPTSSRRHSGVVLVPQFPHASALILPPAAPGVAGAAGAGAGVLGAAASSEAEGEAAR